MSAPLCFRRPGSVPSAGRKDKGYRRPASGAVARSGRSPTLSCGKVDLAITGSGTSLPCMGSIGVPEIRLCSPHAINVESTLPERPPGAKMMGTLASALTGPLKDCTSFQRLRDATTHLSNRTQNASVGYGFQQARHHQQQSISDISILSEPPSPSNQRPLEEAPAVPGELCSGEAAVRHALIVATTRQCCRLLRRGWETIEAAAQTLPILVGLRDDGLLHPLGEVQQAALEALLSLFRKIAGSVRSKATPGSFAAWTDPETNQSEPRARASGRPPSAIQVDMQKWAQQAKVFARLSELRFLPSHGLERASQLVEAELRRILRAPTPQELRRVAQRLAEGGLWLARANACQCTEMSREGYSVALLETSSQARNSDSLPVSVREIAVVALRTASESDRDGPAAMAAREALQRFGLVDITDEFPDCSAMVVREPKRSSSAPEFGNVLPGLQGLRKGKQKPTVLESGLWQLEAAKAIIRESRLPPGSMQSRGGRR